MPESASEISLVVDEGGERLDKLLAGRLVDLSRTKVQGLIDEGAVLVNGTAQKPSYVAKAGETITVRIPEEEPRKIEPEEIPLDVVYEDSALLVVNKPAGMVVHPAVGHWSGTLVNALLAYYPPIEDVGPRERAGIVHRLDKDTSGVLIVAKRNDVRRALQRQFKRRQVEKVYLALVEGRVEPREGIIDVPIGRDPHHRQRMAPVRTGRPARTHYRVAEYFPKLSLLEVHPRTGRTHQIRVHLSWFGHPVVGDEVYGRRTQDLLQDRHFLHAAEIAFTHPLTDERMAIDAPLSRELEEILEELRRS